MGADATARFDLKINADASSTGPAASALVNLAKRIQEDQKALGELQKAQKNLQGGTNINIEAFKSLQKQIDAKKASIAASSEQFLSLGGNMGKLSSFLKKGGDDSKKAKGDLDSFLGAVNESGSPLGQYATKLQNVAEAFGQLGPAGLIGVAVLAVITLSLALFAGVAALARYGLAAADAARTAGIFREANAGSAAAASRLDKEISILSARVPTARAELEKLGNDLARSGLSGNVLQTSLSAIATASAVMGSQVGSTLQGIIDRARLSKRFILSAFDLQGTGLKIQDVGAAVAKRLGISVQAAIAAMQNGQIKLADGVAALEDAVQKKFGGAAMRLTLSFPTQIAKAKENLDRLFAGVKIEPVLQALHGVLGLLDENTSSGKALKAIFETVLNPIFEAIGSKGGVAKAFFQGMIIVGLGFAIAILKAKKALNETFGTSSGIDSTSAALTAGKVVAIALVAGVGMLTAAFVLLAIATFIAFLPLILLGVAMVAVVAGIVWLVAHIGEAVSWLGELGAKAYKAGSDMIQGLGRAISSGKEWVVNLVKNLANSIITGITGPLEIHSPSRKMARLGNFTTKGYAIGIEEGIPEVHDSMANAFGLGSSSPGDVSPDMPALPPAAGAREVRNYYFGDVYLAGRKQLRDRALIDELTSVFEQAEAMAGSKR